MPRRGRPRDRVRETDREATARSRAEAERLGIAAFLDRCKGQTGTVGVLDATGTPVEVLTGEMRTEPYVSAVAKAKGIRRRDDHAPPGLKYAPGVVG